MNLKIAAILFLSVLILSGCLAEVEDKINKADAKPKEDFASQNSEILAALAKAGIKSALVDVSAERVLIRLEIPQGKSNWAVVYYALAAGAKIAPDTKYILIEVVEKGEIKARINVPTEKAAEYAKSKDAGAVAKSIVIT